MTASEYLAAIPIAGTAIVRATVTINGTTTSPSTGDLKRVIAAFTSHASIPGTSVLRILSTRRKGMVNERAVISKMSMIAASATATARVADTAVSTTRVAAAA